MKEQEEKKTKGNPSKAMELSYELSKMFADKVSVLKDEQDGVSPFDIMIAIGVFTGDILTALEEMLHKDNIFDFYMNEVLPTVKNTCKLEKPSEESPKEDVASK